MSSGGGFDQRSAGVLLHVTSLPGEFGVGDLGVGAREFVDFLKRSGQSVWQVLPLGPTLHGDSPYSCYSAFAGSATLIDLATLEHQGLLSSEHMVRLRQQSASRGALNEKVGPENGSTTERCDYALAHEIKAAGLKLAFESFRNKSACAEFDEFETFCTTQKWWLDSYALFTALMKHFGTDDWTSWGEGLSKRDPQALGEWKQKLEREFEFEQFVQFLFFQQWLALRQYANEQGVLLFGDMPIFVAHGSADVWANQSIFCLREDGKPDVVAGVPPDYFSKTGQLWGNPLYNWTALEKSQYQWWIQRFRSAFELFDLLRIDHFRGFEAYWEVPASAKTAVAGRWVPGPRVGPFAAARAALGDLPIVAEDLGLITDEVHHLRDELHFPGMRVLQFGFDNEHDYYHRPSSFPVNSVGYTGTHDNSTIMGWYESRKSHAVAGRLLQKCFERLPAELPIHWRLISMVYGSDSYLVIAPLQDILGLDDRSRMNIPGEPTGNWGWRYSPAALTSDVANQLKQITVASRRTNSVSGAR